LRGENRRRDGVKAFERQARENISISVLKALTVAPLLFTTMH